MIVRARFRDLDIPSEPREAASAEARMLALAYRIEQAVEDGSYRSVAHVATALCVSRSRLSQVMQQRWTEVAKQALHLGIGPAVSIGHTLLPPE